MKKIILFALTLSSLALNAQIKNVLVPYRKSNQWGFSDSNGKIVIQPVYDSVTLFNTLYVAKKEKFLSFSKVFKNNKVGLLSNENTFLIPLNYTEIISTNDSDQFIVKNSYEKFGLIDFDKSILANEYDIIQEIRGDYYLIEKNGKIGISDKKGKIVIPLIYDQLSFISQENKQDKWKVVNSQETKYHFTPIKEVNDQMSIDNTIGDYLIEDRTIPFDSSILEKYDWYKKHKEYGYAFIFEEKEKYGFMNTKSKNTFKGLKSRVDFLDNYFDKNSRCQHFILTIEENNRKGIIDEKGSIMVPAIYDKIYKDGRYCVVKSNDLIGFYFINTKVFIEPKFKKTTGIEFFGSDYSLTTFKIIGVYEDTKQNWYYLGENGVEFKEL